MPLYRAFALILVKVKRFFWKLLARDAPTRTYIIYTPKTDWYLCVLACPSHETAVARDELAVYAENSLENFPHISCSRQKVVRLFKKWYGFSESPTTFPHISCSHRCISCSHRQEHPSRTREHQSEINQREQSENAGFDWLDTANTGLYTTNTHLHYN